MNDRLDDASREELWAVERFDIASLEDEIRADQACQKLLRLFYLHQVEQGFAPEDAGALTRGADYFLRDFIIADRRENIFRFSPGRVRQFAGNWYIVKNLEPNQAELGTILAGIGAFFEFARREAPIDPAMAEAVGMECRDFDFYCRRIEEFGAIENDGFLAWDPACPLKD